MRSLFMSLLIFPALLTDVHPEEIFVRAGDMVALHCPKIRNTGQGATRPIWTSYTPHKRILTSNMNSSHFLLDKRSLILLSAAIDQHGNYSCSMGNNTFWFKLFVYAAVSSNDQQRVQYPTTCYTQDPCSIRCPISNSPQLDTPNMTRTGVTWSKEKVFKDVLTFSSVKETDQGVYTCTRSYQYKGQTYNMSFTNILTVKPKEVLPDVRILVPRDKDVFKVNLGYAFVVNCTAMIYSAFDEVFWMTENLSVETNPNSRVFFNYTMIKNATGTYMTASLIFREVLDKDLSKNYTCKLESVSVPSSFITISLAQRKQIMSLLFLILIVVAMILMTAVVALSCTKFKMDILLFVRDQLCIYRKSTDTKPFDVYLMFYENEEDKALSKDDTKWLKDVLEKDFGYKLCLYRVSTGENMSHQASQKPLLDCLQQSHSVILIPTVSNPDAECNSLLDLSLLENHNTSVILIQTRPEKKSKLRPKLKLQEALLLPGNSEKRAVTWKGSNSRKLSSSFCKQLRYFLPPPQCGQEDMISEIYFEK